MPLIVRSALARVTLVGISVVGSGRRAGCGLRGGCCLGVAGSGAAGEQVLVGVEIGCGCGAGGELLCIGLPWAGVGALASQDVSQRRCQSGRVVGRDEDAAAITEGGY